MALGLDLIKRNPRALISIVVKPGQKPVTGLTTSRLSLGGGNDFSAPLGSSASEALSKTISAIAAVGNMTADAIGSKFRLQPQSVVSISQTLKTWTSSKSPIFSMDFLLIATKESDNILTTIKKLQETHYPTAPAFGLGNFYKAPLGYSAVSTDPNNLSAEGTIAVSIGGYFRAMQQVVVDFDAELSQETIRNGSPLYAECRIQFAPFVAPTLDIMQGYLVNAS